MKERGIGSHNSQPELSPIESGLTQKPVNPTLDTGDIFMVGENGEGQQPPVNPQDRAREAWGKVNVGRTVPLAERRTQDMLIEKGIMPMAGASDTEPTPEEVLRPAPPSPEQPPPSRIEVEQPSEAQMPEGFFLTIDEQGAKYITTKGPISEEQRRAYQQALASEGRQDWEREKAESLARAKRPLEVEQVKEQ